MLAAVLLAIVLAVAWMSKEIERARRIRDLNAPAAPAKRGATSFAPLSPRRRSGFNRPIRRFGPRGSQVGLDLRHDPGILRGHVLLFANFDHETIQRLLGHSNIKTTMIYLQTVPSVTLKEAKSPQDCL